jgi:acyl carrier protein|tara:strand:+ start:1039 stop:1272 length:234 start_codon:yes stop_codon:yes gene_type:complete
MTIFDTIKQVMSDLLDVDINDITEDSSPDNIEKWDSLFHIKLIIALEVELDIQLTPEDAMDMLSAKLIKLIIEEKMK